MLSLMSAEPPPDSVHPVTAVNLLNSRSWTWVDVLALCPRRLPPGNFSSHLRIIDRLISTHGRQYLCNTEGLSRRPRAPIRPYVSRSDLPTARIGNRRLCTGVNSRLQTFLRHRSIPLTCRRAAISFIAGRPGLRAVEVCGRATGAIYECLLCLTYYPRPTRSDMSRTAGRVPVKDASNGARQ